MLNINALPILLKMVSKLDVRPAIKILKDLDIFEDTDDPEKALSELSGEKTVECGLEVFNAILPQLDKIADYIPEFVAMYKNVPIEEAGQFDAFEVIEELIHDEGIRDFFIRALRKKVEQRH